MEEYNLNLHSRNPPAIPPACANQPPKCSTARRKQQLVQAVTDRETFAELVQQKRPSSGPDGEIDVFNPLQMSVSDDIGDLGGDIELNDMQVRRSDEVK